MLAASWTHVLEIARAAIVVQHAAAATRVALTARRFFGWPSAPIAWCLFLIAGSRTIERLELWNPSIPPPAPGVHRVGRQPGRRKRR
jgi:hypothetical protein